MLLIAFSFYDTKASFFSAPFYMAHRGQAIRAAMDLGTDRSTTIGKYPSDFNLYELGTFDDATGLITPTQPFNMGPVSGFLPQQNVQATPAGFGQRTSDQEESF